MTRTIGSFVSGKGLIPIPAKLVPQIIWPLLRVKFSFGKGGKTAHLLRSLFLDRRTGNATLLPNPRGGLSCARRPRGQEMQTGGSGGGDSTFLRLTDCGTRHPDPPSLRASLSTGARRPQTVPIGRLAFCHSPALPQDSSRIPGRSPLSRTTHGNVSTPSTAFLVRLHQ